MMKELAETKMRIDTMSRSPFVITNDSDLFKTDPYICIIVISDGMCNSGDLKVLNLEAFVNVREFRVGNECFKCVRELKLIGLTELASVVSGEKSFTLCGANVSERNSNRHFYLKNCPKLKSLKIGGYSFSDYSVCEIENVDALEVIEMGELNFNYASLELQSSSRTNEMTLRLTEDQITRYWSLRLL